MKILSIALFGVLALASSFAQVDNRYCSAANVWVGNTSDGPALLPQRCINTALVNTPSPDDVVTVAAGQNLQAAYNAISCGSTLLLSHGASWDAPFAFASKGCDAQHWITIKSDGNLPPEGMRVTAANQPELAILSFAPNKPEATFGDHIRFIGIAWTKKPGGPLVGYGIGKGAKYIIFDRNRFLGNPLEETRRGFTLHDGQYIAIIESDFEEFHCIAPGTCVDAQAIGAGAGPEDLSGAGPFKIVNNFLEASGENIIFGGGLGNSCSPNDVEIRRNHLFKPMTWNPNDPNFIGTRYIVKNLFELKNGCRILVEGNILENSWGGFTQDGYGVLLTPKNPAPNQCPMCAVVDVTFRYNKVSNVAAFALIANIDIAGGWSQGLHRISVHDVIVDGIQYPTCYQCTLGLGQLANAYSSTAPPANSTVMSDLLVNHITQVSGLTLATGNIPLGWLALNGPPQNNPTGTATIQNVSWLNSISLAGSAGTFATGGGANNCSALTGIKRTPLSQLAACFFGSSQFSGNVFITAGSQRTPSDWPAGNLFVADWPSLGFVNYGGDYHLTLASPVHKQALDGRDPGADVDMVSLFTQGVL